ncbi:Necrosis inducing-like protein NPP1 type [Phytophthora palmivora]|uniref:Necrosis inducing-like protein NPP1 type n=1 Tax=Phytophthora palmivora TaxID=4796 RepID=A0A2P4WXT0_9STRA|nr:Necrosis inducing-like protein NPP1 type [Phytophthora palmivora]
MYAWYFPKGFWDKSALWRHEWSSAVLWIDNPAVENPKVLAISLSKSNSKYNKEEPANLVNNAAPILVRSLPAFSNAKLEVTLDTNAQSQDLIMWEQLTDAARTALNDEDNFGRADVPFNDNNFLEWLEQAWPFES